MSPLCVVVTTKRFAPSRREYLRSCRPSSIRKFRPLDTLEVGRLVLHRGGGEGIGELRGEPLRAFPNPLEAFRARRYDKIGQTMRDIDRTAGANAKALAARAGAWLRRRRRPDAVASAGTANRPWSISAPAWPLHSRANVARRQGIAVHPGILLGGNGRGDDGQALIRAARFGVGSLAYTLLA